eukprot:g58098.t1
MAKVCCEQRGCVELSQQFCFRQHPFPKYPLRTAKPRDWCFLPCISLLMYDKKYKNGCPITKSKRCMHMSTRSSHFGSAAFGGKQTPPP